MVYRLLYYAQTQISDYSRLLHYVAVRLVESFGVGRQVSDVKLRRRDSTVETILEARLYGGQVDRIRHTQSVGWIKAEIDRRDERLRDRQAHYLIQTAYYSMADLVSVAHRPLFRIRLIQYRLPLLG